MPELIQSTRVCWRMLVTAAALVGWSAWAQDEAPPKAIPVEPAPPPATPADKPLIRPDAEQNAIDYANLVYNKNYYDINK